VFVKKVTWAVGSHCYADSTHPDELVLEPPPKKIPGSVYDYACYLDGRSVNKNIVNCDKTK